MVDVTDGSVPLTSPALSSPMEPPTGGLVFIEFSATKWIVGIWTISFVVACVAAQAIHSFATESFRIAMSCLGILLIVAWYGLYGALRLGADPSIRRRRRRDVRRRWLAFEAIRQCLR